MKQSALKMEKLYTQQSIWSAMDYFYSFETPSMLLLKCLERLIKKDVGFYNIIPLEYQESIWSIAMVSISDNYRAVYTSLLDIVQDYDEDVIPELLTKLNLKNV